MARLYADENFHSGITEALRKLGHDVLTAQEAGQANQKIPDPLVLTFAVNLTRAVLTHNRKDYIKLHKRKPLHSGIVVCTFDEDLLAVAQRIDAAISANDPLDNKLIRVNKPSKP